MFYILFLTQWLVTTRWLMKENLINIFHRYNVIIRTQIICYIVVLKVLKLYTTYEATYGLKCLVFEKLAKNWFLHDRVAKIHNFRYLLHKCHTIVSRFKLRTDQNGKQLWRLKHIIHIYDISFMSRSWCCKYYLIPMLVRVMVDISSIWEVRDPIFLKIGITWYANHNTKRINDDYWPQMP